MIRSSDRALSELFLMMLLRMFSFQMMTCFIRAVFNDVAQNVFFPDDD